MKLTFHRLKYSLSLSLSSFSWLSIFLLFSSSYLIICLWQVEIIALETSAGSNITKVVFAFDSDVKNLRVSSTAQSLIRASFVSLVIHQSSLRLTASLFGDPFSFEVLKFTGGITVSPLQSAFLMQKVQILFNFTLNSSIDQIQNYFYELTSQLKSGLRNDICCCDIWWLFVFRQVGALIWCQSRR